MYINRVGQYKQLEQEFNGKVLAYITGDRPGFETRIAPDVIDLFISHLDKIGPVERIVLFLYTRGGDISAAWNIVNLLRMYCDDLTVICVVIPVVMITPLIAEKRRRNLD